MQRLVTIAELDWGPRDPLILMVDALPRALGPLVPALGMGLADPFGSPERSMGDPCVPLPSKPRHRPGAKEWMGEEGVSMGCLREG